MSQPQSSDERTKRASDEQLTRAREAAPSVISRDIDRLVRLEYALWQKGERAKHGSGDVPEPGMATPAGEAPFRSHVSRPPEGDLAGLAFSGGGIRSATYNLGVLQALARHGLLKHFHYLSTVSGGGYVGGFWTAWRQRAGRAGGGARPEFPLPDEATGYESTEVRHLREFSRFLSPQLGLFSFDGGRMATALINSVVPAIVASLAGVTLLLLALLGGAWWMLRFPAWVEAKGLVANLITLDSLGADAVRALGGFVAMLVFLLLFRLLMESLWRGGDESRDRANGTHLLIIAFASVGWAVATLADGIAIPSTLTDGMYLIGVPDSYDDVRWRAVFYPPLIWLGTSMVVAIVRSLLGPAHKSSVPSRVRAEMDRASSWLLFAALGWGTVAALWWLAHLAVVPGDVMARAGKLTGSALTVSGLLGWLIKRLTSLRDGRTRGAFGVRISLSLLADLAAATLVVGVMLLVVQSYRGGWMVGLTITVFVIVVVALWKLDPNAFGLHAFYRERIARAYLGASNASRTRGSDILDGDDLALDATPWTDGPVQLVCCAANDLHPRNPMENLYRGAASAVLSPVGFSVGDQWYAWPVPKREQPPPFVPFLSSALTASGAAFNSQMGAKSIELGPAATFLLGTLGFRLGLWIRHPRNLERRDRFSWHTFPGLYFFAEVLGYSRAVANKVLLSDGGHFENLGLYELVRRHCRFIIVSDCGADPSRTFDDLGNAVRRVREDFGVEIRIDLSPLRLQEGRTASQAMVAGEILYPQGDTGTLLLFKPTLTGDEPPDVANYARLHSEFPQESTGDQFYDAAQWEAYRQLGLHTVERALQLCEIATIARATNDRPDAGVLPVLFARAGKEWAARPPDFRDRARRIADRLQGLDEALARASGTLLRKQVYPEIDAINERAADGEAADTQAVDSTVTDSSKIADSGAATDSGNATDRKVVEEQFAADPAELAESLLLVRKAMVAFEEIFLTERLGQFFELPLYLGTTNYIARWAYAPLTRLWWPVIRAHCSEAFRRFMEERFQLRVPDSTMRVELAAEVDGAVDLTKLRAEDAAWKSDLAFVLRTAPPTPNAPQLIVVVGGIRWRPSSDGDTAEWDAADFVIAPALWGMRMGDAFLDKTIDWLKRSTDVPHCQVRIARRARSAYTDRQAGAYLPSFYRAHGFVDVSRASSVDGGEGEGEVVRLLHSLGRPRGTDATTSLPVAEGELPQTAHQRSRLK